MSHTSSNTNSGGHEPSPAQADNAVPKPGAKPVLRLATDHEVETENHPQRQNRRAVVDRRAGIDRRAAQAGLGDVRRPRPQPVDPKPPIHAEPADEAALNAAVQAGDDEAEGPIYGPRTIKLPGEGASAGGGSGLERRRGAGRRLSDFTRSAEEGELTPEQFLFVMAIQEFKRANAMSFPAWTDVLEVIRLLGYRKTQPSQLNLRNAEDWREQPDAPANVRPKGWEKRAA